MSNASIWRKFQRSLGLQGREELPYLRDVNAAIVNEKHPLAQMSIAFMALLLLAGGVWANNANLEVITLGQGKVVPSSREQVIQSLDAGILAEMKVREGDTVEKGQELLRIDDTKFGASVNEGQSKALALMATVARLKGEISGTTPKFPALVAANARVMQTELALYRAKLTAVTESVSAIQRSAELIEKELLLTEPLAAKGLTAEVDVLRLRRQANEARMQVAERWNKYRADANADLAKAEAELAQTSSAVVAREDLLRRTVVRSPVRGTVKNIRISTVGGVIQSGQDIMEIVPTDERLLIEAKVRPADVAFLRPGLKATVKLSAYDYSIYGGMEGVVDHISADTINEDKRNAAPGEEVYYRVLVKTNTTGLVTAKNETLPVLPGMTATVEIMTGQRTVMAYLLKPIKRASEAMREH